MFLKCFWVSISVVVRHPSAVWCFDLQKEDKIPTRLLPKFCTGCSKVRRLLCFDRDAITQYWTYWFIKWNHWFQISAGSLRNRSCRSSVIFFPQRVIGWRELQALIDIYQNSVFSNDAIQKILPLHYNDLLYRLQETLHHCVSTHPHCSTA